MSEYKIIASEPHIFIPDDYFDFSVTTVKHKRIGEILQEADLVSAAQIEIALQDQQQYNLHLGEILALRGWIKQETADFFAQTWYEQITESKKLPLGYYLKEANLLTQEQIEIILQEQKIHWLKFGAIAVLKGWLKQTTVDFFIENLFPERKTDSIYIEKPTISTESIITFESKIIEPTSSSEISKIFEQLNHEHDYSIIENDSSTSSRKNNSRFNSTRH